MRANKLGTNTPSSCSGGGDDGAATARDAAPCAPVEGAVGDGAAHLDTVGDGTVHRDAEVDGSDEVVGAGM